MIKKNASEAVRRERNRLAQEAYRQRQAKVGRKPRMKYLTMEENKIVDAFINKIRGQKEPRQDRGKEEGG